MNAFEQLELYLKALERRMRLATFSRGIALSALSALVATVLLVLVMNAYAFSEGSLTWSRIALFLAIAFAIALGIVVPLIQVNHQRAAKRAESQIPEFGDRLLTFAERKSIRDPFMELLAHDTMQMTRDAEPSRLVSGSRIFAAFLVAFFGISILVWLTHSNIGFMSHGAALLWSNPTKDADPYYSIRVTPGDKRVRRRTDQMISAQLMGFQSQNVRLFAKFKGTAKW